MAVRADREDVPEELLAFFQNMDPDRDAERFWEQLRTWYQDADGSWVARWRDFVFPAADFTSATFSGIADFCGATFSGEANFRSAAFSGEANFVSATFSSGAVFDAATFSLDARFDHVTFTGPVWFGAVFSRKAGFSYTTFSDQVMFVHATFSGEASFHTATFVHHHVDFQGATFSDDAKFDFATFSGDAHFGEVTFASRASFSATTFSGRAIFRWAAFLGPGWFDHAKISNIMDMYGCRINDLSLGLVVSDGGRLLIEGDCGIPASHSPTIAFGRMSLERVRLAGVTAASIRFRNARDIDKVSIESGVIWPGENRSRPRVADEEELNEESERRIPATELERIYRALRKNFEEQSDRVRAHGWYRAEMEVGRKQAPWRFRRLARSLYWASSDYGLSWMRPLAWLAGTIVVATVLFAAPWTLSCVKATSPRGLSCAGLSQAIEVALRAAFQQSPQDSVFVEGLLVTTVWLLVRIVSAAMLLSFGIAFRNQVAR